MSSAREDADAMEGALLDAIAAFETEISKLKAENAKLKAEIEQRADHESYLSQEFANTYYEKNARIAELEAERRWVPFDWEHKENQPDHMQVCLVLTADNEMYSAMFLSDNCWTGLCRDFGRDEVAYWMQSPEPTEVK